MMTKAKKMMPKTIVMIEMTFSGPRSFTFWKRPRSPFPVNADKASDLPPCKSEITISNTATISNHTFIIHLLEFCFRQIDIVDISRCFTAEKDNQDGSDLCLVVH